MEGPFYRSQTEDLIPGKFVKVPLSTKDFGTFFNGIVSDLSLSKDFKTQNFKTKVSINEEGNILVRSGFDLSKGKKMMPVKLGIDFKILSPRLIPLRDTINKELREGGSKTIKNHLKFLDKNLTAYSFFQQISNGFVDESMTLNDLEWNLRDNKITLRLRAFPTVSD
jgi:hypothetical protein